ncbi:MAG: hypothetical protein A3H42_04665 [Deltaproteobacteria bacterium RIFCSPLOWO2_02_FULL_46_8]|nr:MAG: hypothetical protein A3H42_04665 [Deltaproteobacteria bacterium RIFCSPLOWO2_02_FULL_46_8]
MGNGPVVKPTETKFRQLEANIGTSQILEMDQAAERFSYYNYDIYLRTVHPHENWISGFVSGGPSVAHSDESALGSLRLLIGGEAGVRLFVPMKILRLFTLEAGVTAGLGWSKLNFGGGDNPVAGFDGHVGGLARLSMEHEGFRAGIQVFAGGSPFRDYWEKGLGVTFSVPLGSIAEVIEESPISCGFPINLCGFDPCFKELATLEEETGVAQEESQKNKTLLDKVQLLAEQVKAQFDMTEQLRQEREKQKKKLEKEDSVCPAIPKKVEGLAVPTRYPELPKRPAFKSCSEGLDKLKKYLKDLRFFTADASRYSIYLDQQNDGLKKLLELYGRLQKWPSECRKPEIHEPYIPGDKDITVIKIGQTTYRLLTDLLFPNKNPNLHLSPQTKLDKKGKSVSGGVTEPYLDEWIRFLRDHPKAYKIQIDGYASENFSPDAKFNEKQRMELSEKRAKNVADYLLNRGRSIVSGTQCQKFSKNPSFSLRDDNNKKVRIDNIPFVPCKAEGPIGGDQIYAVRGHGDEGLEKLAKDKFGEKFGSDLLSDPAFRMVRITLLEKQPDGTFKPVRLEGRAKP